MCRTYKLLIRAGFAIVVLLLVRVAPADSGLRVGWSTPGTPSHTSLGLVHDFDHDGIDEIVTVEQPTASGYGRVGFHSAATGVLLRRSSVALHRPENLVHADIDANGRDELIFYDSYQNRLYCYEYVPGGSTIFHKWYLSSNFSPTFGLVRLEGGGQKFLVFVAGSGFEFWVYRSDGTLYGNYRPSPPAGYAYQGYEVIDVDTDGREEILATWEEATRGLVYMLLIETDLAAGVDVPMPEVSGVSLGRSTPNPSVGEARIAFSIAERGAVRLVLYDVAGRRVRTLLDGVLPAGSHETIWDGRDDAGSAVAAGAYYYEFEAAGLRETRRAIRLR